MSNAERTNSKSIGAQYATKMNGIATKALQEWWSGLSKEELLQYLSDQPTLTADHIRDMLSNMHTKLAFDISFELASQVATTDFHTK